jgi:hypothetical protein
MDDLSGSPRALSGILYAAHKSNSRLQLSMALAFTEIIVAKTLNINTATISTSLENCLAELRILCLMVI